MGRTSEGGREEKPERQQGMECTPQMALRLPFPRERKPALFPWPYLMLWSEEPARAGVKAACLGTSEAPQWGLRAADIRLACGFFLWLLHLRVPHGCYFCSCLGFCAGLLCARH